MKRPISNVHSCHAHTGCGRGAKFTASFSQIRSNKLQTTEQPVIQWPADTAIAEEEGQALLLANSSRIK